MVTLNQVRRMDDLDPLAGFRSQFVIDDPDQCYLDGNSLGRLPLATLTALERVVRHEWGAGLVTGWERWLDASERIGDLLGRVALGAAPGQVLVTDTTSLNLYRLAIAALRDRPGRRTIVIDEANFPTDRYVLQGIARDLGYRLVTIPNRDPTIAQDERITAQLLDRYLDDDVALVSLQVVNYRSGARQDVAGLTELVHAHGAHLLWDAAHAVGALDLQFDTWGVQLAVGCTYKYCNAGPGAPAWMYVAHDVQGRLEPPVDGWFGQRDQFAMGPQFDRAPGMRGFQVGTPPVVGLACVESAVTLMAEASMSAIEAKCAQGTEMMIELIDAWLQPLGFSLQTPRDPEHRGGHVSVAHPDAGQISVALRTLANVIPDFREPNIIRLAVSPLATSFTEIFTGLERLRELVVSGAYRSVEAGGQRVT